MSRCEARVISDALPSGSTFRNIFFFSGLYVAGETVKATLTPIGDKAAGYLPVTTTMTNK